LPELSNERPWQALPASPEPPPQAASNAAAAAKLATLIDVLDRITFVLHA
jgi:hypothetical protein